MLTKQHGVNTTQGLIIIPNRRQNRTLRQLTLCLDDLRQTHHEQDQREFYTVG
jgi:hypothetical protein